MRERILFLRDYASKTFSFAELCVHYGISRKTGYKRLMRFSEEDVEGLRNRPRIATSFPHAIDHGRADIILQIKRRHPRWGPKKIKAYLERERPALHWPAASTIGDLLKKHGLVKSRRRRRKPGHPGFLPIAPTCPNQIWTADFKSEFKTQDGIYCYPFTVVDGFSRYLLACEGLPGPQHAPTRAVFERLFTDIGLPMAIRTDNGSPFASQAIHRLSRLQVWWIRLGITPLLIEPASPHQNGSHERMHRTLKHATALPSANDASAQQIAFDRFRHEYNHIHPHEALGQQTPASCYRPSHRPYPHTLPELQYPPHFELRKVSRNGGIRWRRGWVNVSQVLAEEFVGLEEVDYRVWSVYLGPLLLGRFKEDDLQLHGAHAYNRPI